MREKETFSTFFNRYFDGLNKVLASNVGSKVYIFFIGKVRVQTFTFNNVKHKYGEVIFTVAIENINPPKVLRIYQSLF